MSVVQMSRKKFRYPDEVVDFEKWKPTPKLLDEVCHKRPKWTGSASCELAPQPDEP